VNVLASAQELIASGFRRIVSGDPDGQPEWVRELAHGMDAGYFGPGSAPWTVHGSLPTLVGGVRALLTQTLHPAALAGVRQHSRYESDALGRLVGTSQWLTVTTFGDTASVDRECARVKGMHRRVTGEFADASGAPQAYAASDPNLLRWVHIAFAESFLATHLVWGGKITGGPDAYVREWAKAGELVGVTDVPRSHAELKEAMASYADVLRGDSDTWDTVRFIRQVPLPRAAGPAYAVLFAGAASTLSADQARLLRIRRTPLAVTRPTVAAALGALSLAVGSQSGALRNARHRISRLGVAA
jgi:uncharacterized protein (DUF2236 family)